MKHLTSDREYLETDLGSIPAEWEYKELGPVLKELRNGLVKTQNREHGAYAVTRIETISQDRVNPDKVGYVENLTDTEVGTYRLAPGDILFSHINSDPQIGRSVVYTGYPPELLHGMNLLRIRVDEACLDPWFLSYLFAHYRSKGVFIKLASRAVNQSSINQGKLRALRVFLPPLYEQRRIAAVLNIIQDAIAAQEDVIAAAEEFKRSLMHRLFTYGPGQDPAPTKETEIGEIPAHWSLQPLDKLVTRMQNGLYKSAESYGDGHPILRIDAYGPGDTISYRQELKRLRLTPEELSSYTLNNGDIVMNRVNGNIELVGKAAIIGHLSEPTVFESNIIRVSVDSVKLCGQFLLEYLSSPTARNQVRKRARHVHQASLNQQDIKSLPVPYPPYDEQLAIAQILSVAVQKVAAEEDRLAALQDLFKSMLHQLMTGQIRLLSDEGLPLA